MNIRSCAIGAALSVMTGLAAHAGTVVFSPGVLNGDPNYQAGIPVNLGMVFTANANVNATALGFYAGANVTAGEALGLYDSGGNLLASTFVTLSDPIVGGYYFANIAPVALTSGASYTVVAQTGNNPWEFGTLGATPPQITFNYDSYFYGSTLHYTTNTGGSGPAYFGPNLQIGVPEPAAWALMLIGVAGVGGAMRSTRRKTAVAV